MSGKQQAGGCEWHFSSREGGRAKEATRDQVIPGYEDLITCGEQFGINCREASLLDKRLGFCFGLCTVGF